MYIRKSRDDLRRYLIKKLSRLVRWLTAPFIYGFHVRIFFFKSNRGRTNKKYEISEGIYCHRRTRLIENRFPFVTNSFPLQTEVTYIYWLETWHNPAKLCARIKSTKQIQIWNISYLVCIFHRSIYIRVTIETI